MNKPYDMPWWLVPFIILAGIVMLLSGLQAFANGSCVQAIKVVQAIKTLSIKKDLTIKVWYREFQNSRIQSALYVATPQAGIRASYFDERGCVLYYAQLPPHPSTVEVLEKAEIVFSRTRKGS